MCKFIHTHAHTRMLVALLYSNTQEKTTSKQNSQGTYKILCMLPCDSFTICFHRTYSLLSQLSSVYIAYFIRTNIFEQRKITNWILFVTCGNHTFFFNCRSIEQTANNLSTHFFTLSEISNAHHSVLENRLTAEKCQHSFKVFLLRW